MLLDPWGPQNPTIPRHFDTIQLEARNLQQTPNPQNAKLGLLQHKG